MNRTPFFPVWRCRLAPMKSGLEQLRSATFFTVDEITSRFLGRDVLAGQEKGPHSRRRVFSLARTLSSFLFQCLNPGMSCREVVRQIQAACCQTGTRQTGTRQISSATTCFCNARSALPEDRCWKALEATARHASRNAARLTPGRLAGRRVIVADASSTQLPDTPANQSEYPPALRPKTRLRLSCDALPGSVLPGHRRHSAGSRRKGQPA